MMSHVDIGARILGQARSPVLRTAAEIARTHHERWDGRGYLLRPDAARTSHLPAGSPLSLTCSTR